MAKQCITYRDLVLNQLPDDFDIELVSDELTVKHRFSGRYAKCPVCSKWFKMFGSKQECCSRECAMSLKASRGKLGKKKYDTSSIPVYVFKKCPNCGKLYKTSRKLLEHGHGLFCSVMCARNAFKFNLDIKYYICNNCGGVFPMLTNKPMMLFCCLNCLNAYMLEHYSGRGLVKIYHLMPKPYQDKKYACLSKVEYIKHIELTKENLIEASKKQKTFRNFDPNELLEIYGKRIKKTALSKQRIIIVLDYDRHTGLYDVIEHIYTGITNDVL